MHAARHPGAPSGLADRFSSSTMEAGLFAKASHLCCLQLFDRKVPKSCGLRMGPSSASFNTGKHCSSLRVTTGSTFPVDIELLLAHYVSSNIGSKRSQRSPRSVQATSTNSARTATDRREVYAWLSTTQVTSIKHSNPVTEHRKCDR